MAVPENATPKSINSGDVSELSGARANLKHPKAPATSDISMRIQANENRIRLSIPHFTRPAFRAASLPGPKPVTSNEAFLL